MIIKNLVLFNNLKIFIKERSNKIQNEQLNKIFFSLSDNYRRFMLSILVLGDCTVSDIAEKTDISLASASKHIQVLVSCGLISQKKVARQMICQINLNML